MDKDSQPPKSDEPKAGEEQLLDGSRRRLAKASVAAVVLMTVANRSAMAGMGGSYGSKTYNKNCTYSAWMSAGGSGPSGLSCYGKTCDDWKSSYSKWPSPCKESGGYGSSWSNTYTSSWSYRKSGSSYNGSVDNTALFKSCFGYYPNGYTPPAPSSNWGGAGGSSSWGNSNASDEPSLLDVLTDNKNKDPGFKYPELEKQCVAALLNAVDDSIPFGYLPKDVINMYKSARTSPSSQYGNDLLAILKILNAKR